MLDAEEALEYGVVFKPGPRNNKTDCESDIVLLHVPTGEFMRFHGCYWDSAWGAIIDNWIKSHVTVTEDVSALDVALFMNMSVDKIKPKRIP